MLLRLLTAHRASARAPVTWWTLATHGIACRGDPAGALGVYADRDDVRRFVAENVDTYWRAIAAQIRDADGGGIAGRQPASRQADKPDHDGSDDLNIGIRGPDSKEQGVHGPARDPGPCQSHRDAGAHHRSPLRQHGAAHAGSAGAQSHADAQLPGPTGHGLGQHRVGPNGGQRQHHGREPRDEQPQEPLGLHGP